MTLISKNPQQPYVPAPGFVGEPTFDPITTNLWRIGQINHRFEQGWKMAHGRYLAGFNGFGAMTNMEEPYDPKFDSDRMSKLESQDDVSGSGIFDAPGTRANLHRSYGVFEDYASVPGYVQRENLFRPSDEVKDINGAEVVVVPSGGMTFREQNGVPIDFDARDLPSPCWPDVFSAVACRYAKDGAPAPSEAPIMNFMPPTASVVSNPIQLLPQPVFQVPQGSEPMKPARRPRVPHAPKMPLRASSKATTVSDTVPSRGSPSTSSGPVLVAAEPTPSRGVPMLPVSTSTGPYRTAPATKGVESSLQLVKASNAAVLRPSGKVPASQLRAPQVTRATIAPSVSMAQLPSSNYPQTFTKNGGGVLSVHGLGAAPIVFQPLSEMPRHTAVLGVRSPSAAAHLASVATGPGKAPKHRQVPFQKTAQQLLQMNTQDIGVAIKDVRMSRAMGAEDETTGIGTYIFWGALIGAAAAMVKGATSVKVK